MRVQVYAKLPQPSIMRLTLLVLSLLSVISPSPSSYMASNDDEDYYYNDGVSGSGSGDDNSPTHDTYMYDTYEYKLNERPIVPTEDTSDTSKILVPEIDTDPTNNEVIVETMDTKPKVRPHHEHKTTVAGSKSNCFYLEFWILLYQLI